MDVQENSDNSSCNSEEVIAHVKARLLEEGREARNLVAYSVPIQPHKSPTSDIVHKVPPVKESRKASINTLKHDKRQRSASAGRTPQSSLRARHWGFLFRNLEQAVDEIYQTCEDDESVIECKEAILMLERYTKDFHKLIEWLKLKWEFEKTPPPERPVAVAWEIRTSSSRSISSKKKTHPWSDAKQTTKTSRLTTENVNYKNQLDQNRKFVISPTVDGTSKPRKLSTLKENEIVDKFVTTDGSICLTSDPLSDRNVLLSGNTNSEQAIKKVEIFEANQKSGNFRKPTIQKDGNTDISMTKPHKIEQIDDIEISKTKQKYDHLREPDMQKKQNTELEKLHKIEQSDHDAEKSQTKQKSSLLREPNMQKDRNTDICFIKPQKIEQNNEVEKSQAKQNSDYLRQPEMLKEKNTDTPMSQLDKIEQAEETVEKSVSKQKSDYLRAPEVQEDRNTDTPKLHEDKLGKAEPKKLPDNENLVLSKTNLQIVTSTDQKFAKTTRSIPAPKKPAGSVIFIKDEDKLSCLAPIRSKSTTNLRNISYSKSEPESKRVDQQKISFNLTGPAVNMNKASQVRQAYNQSRAPQKSTKPIVWKNFVGNQGSETKFGTNKPAKSFPPTSNWPMRRSADSSSCESQQKKKWISYTRNCESAPSTRGLIRSVTSLGVSHVTRRATIVPNEFSCSINDDCSRSNCSLASTASSGQSWADKVKGPRKDSEIEHSSSVEDDNEGWEVVRRGRRSQSSLSLNISSKTKVNQISKSKAISFKMQKRFSQPTSAVSLPSLVNEDSVIEKDPDQSIDNKSIPEKSTKVGSPTEKRRNRKELKQEISGSLNKSEKNISNHIRREESKAHGVIDENQYHKTSDTNRPSTLSESQRVRKECISVSENTSDSEREEEEMTKNEVAFASAIKEEKRLKKQIEETEKNSIEVNVEEEVEVSSDSTSTVLEDEHFQKADSEWSLEIPEQTYAHTPSLSWADMGPLDPFLDNIRQPGRVLHIHEKLSSPARCLSSSEKLKKHQQKLAKAEELRGKLIQEKTEKLKDLFRKIEEVIIDKDRLLLEKRHIFEKKMARAEEKRKLYLKQIVDKAHDEETKTREIAFINDLEAQNKLHDIMQLHQSHESRLAEIAEERSRKLEEKAAKESAAQERRRAIEAERQARMAAICEKRRRRCERIDRQQAERREELLEQAREKARDREERLSALQQAQQAKEIELVKKIQQKQEETARRHDENIELIRQRALESSITRCSRGCDDAPKLLRYETKKLCTLCNSLIASEVYLLSHLKSKRHRDALKDLTKDDVSNEQAVKYNLKHIVDAPENIDDPEVIRDQERQKCFKKKCRKIRTRMMSRGNKFLKEFKPPVITDSKSKSRITKDLQQISKLVSSQGSGPWPSSDVSALDKHVLDLHRVIDKGSRTEASVFLSLDGFGKLNEVLEVINSTEDGLSCVLPPKSLSYAIRVMNAACSKFFNNCEYILMANFIVSAVDQLNKRLTELADDVIKHVASGSVIELASDPVCTGLMEFIGYILEAVLKIELDKTAGGTEETNVRIKEVVSYCVSVGIVDKLTWYFNRVQGPVDNDQPSTDFILASMKILSSLTCCLTKVPVSNDPTQLISTIKVTDSYGVVSLLYGLLLHEADRSVSPPSDYFSPSTLAVTDAGTILLCNLAELDLKLFQNILGSEGISLELRHICSFLLWYCSHWPNENILHNVIVLVGFFAVSNKENQSIMQSGETPSVLQQLCNLPWNYFTDTRLTSILFPTLLASCLNNSDNMRIIEQEMSFQILQEFFTKKEACERPLVKILHKLETIL